jgi:inner membrane protein
VALAPFVGLTATTAVLSHLFADALTPMGVRPFEPHDDQEICFDVARAANPIANYGLLVLGGVVVFVGWAFTAAISG